MAATRIAMLEPGVACHSDAEGRLWFSKLEALPLDASECEIVKIRQTELTTLDSLREDCLFVNVL